MRVAELEDNAVTQDDLARVEELAAQARDLAEAAAGQGPGEAPDLSEYATLDDLARVEEIANEARDLAEAAASAGGGDPEALKDLIDQVEAASIAADTALAQARELQDKVDELSGRVDDLESRLGELGATVEGQADSIAALNDLVVLLNQDVLSLQDRVAQLERGQGDLSGALDELAANAASQEDLEALREFTTLLRRDQTALQDRVADLEGRVTKVEADVKALDGRVTVLEANVFTVSGTLSLTYTVSRTWFGNGTGAAPDFDIDRLGLAGSPLSSGTGGVAATNARDFADFGNSRYVLNNSGVATTPVTVSSTSAGGNTTFATTAGVAPTGNREGEIDASVGLSLTLRPRNLLTNPGNFPAGQITIGLTLDNGGDFATDGKDSLTSLNGIALNLTGLSTRFAVGSAPLVINFGIKPAFKFSNYGFSNSGGRGDGFVADLGGAGLPLNAALTIAYGSKSGEQYGAEEVAFQSTGTVPTAQVSTNVTKLTIAGGRRGVFRLTFTLAARGKVTVTFNNGKTIDKTFDSGDQTWEFRGDANSDVIGNYSGVRPGSITKIAFNKTADKGVTGANGDNLYFWGARGSLSVIPGLTGGVYYAQEGLDATGGFGTPASLFGLYGSGKLFGLIDLEGEYAASSNAQTVGYIKAGVTLGIFSVSGNFRNVERNFNGLGDDGPYGKGQSGFGVEASINNLFGFLTLGGYFDSRTKLGTGTLPGGPKQPTWGDANAATGATNFGISGSISVLGFAIGASFDSISETGNGWNTTGLGITARHDGSAAGALIRGLNLALGFYSENHQGTVPVVAANSATTLVAYADLTIGAAGAFQIIPAAWFTSFNGTGAGNSITGLGGKATVNIPFLFGSTLGLAGAFDQTSYGAGAGFGAAMTSNTTWLRGSLSFPSFIFPNSTFSVALATRTDVNRDGNAFGPSFAAPDSVAFSYFSPASPWGRDGFGRGGSLTGLYLAWSYFGLQFQWGLFNIVPFSDPTGAVRFGQQFSIGYSLKF